MGTQIGLLNVGFGNMVAAAKVVAVVGPGSAPMKKLRDVAREAGLLVDATEGRKTRSIIVAESGHVILSALQTETISQRLSAAPEPLTPQTEEPR